MNNISDSEKFIACVKYNHNYRRASKISPLLGNRSDLISFLKTVAPAVNQGRCLLFIDTCCWPFSTAIRSRDTLELFLFLKRMNINNKNNVVLLTSLHSCERDKDVIFKSIFWEHFESALKQCNVKSINIDIKLDNFISCKNTFRFMYLNHKERIHRLYLFVKIFLQIKKGCKKIAASMNPYGSLFACTKIKKNTRSYEQFLSEMSRFKNGNIPDWFFNSTEEKFIKKFRELTFIHNDKQTTSVSTSLVPFASGDMWKDINVQWLHGAEAWERAGIYIGTETNYFYSWKHAQQGNDYLTLTEKTFKPLMMKTPFILYGQPFILKQLKEYGYKTFGDFWDESYDSEIDPALRADKIAGIVNQLIDISDKEFNEMLIKTRDIVEYNYRIFIMRNTEECIYKVITGFYAEKN